jgi:hypothetical protein
VIPKDLGKVVNVAQLEVNVIVMLVLVVEVVLIVCPNIMDLVKEIAKVINFKNITSCWYTIRHSLISMILDSIVNGGAMERRGNHCLKFVLRC